MLIDMHAHVVPEHFPPAAGRDSAARWPRMDHTEPGRANVMIEGRNFRTIHSGNWNAERRLADMDAHGADAEAISPMPELLSYWFTPRDGVDMCRHLNEFIAGLCEAAPARFFGLGAVPLQEPDLATKELASVKQLGLAGVEIGSNVLGKSLGEERFRDFFGEAERQGLAVFVHALHPTVADRISAAQALVGQHAVDGRQAAVAVRHRDDSSSRRYRRRSLLTGGMGGVPPSPTYSRAEQTEGPEAGRRAEGCAASGEAHLPFVTALQRCYTRADLAHGAREGALDFSSFPKCQKCKTGDLVPLSDFGSQGAAIHFKAWVCTNPDCGFNLKIRNGDLYIDEPISSGAVHTPRYR